MLSDLRVLDLTDERGFLAGKILADLGADVIKVEPPGGDCAREGEEVLEVILIVDWLDNRLPRRATIRRRLSPLSGGKLIAVDAVGG